MLSTPEIIAAEDRFQIPTYTKMPFAAVRGSGSYIEDADGKMYLDYYGGHCVALLGHCHPKVVAAVQDQADTLLFYSNAVYSPVRAEAAQRLAELAPDGLSRVFFCNSGTEANETALKLARKFTVRQEGISMVGGFHGRTLGSLAATWNPKYREPYAGSMSRNYFVSFGDLAGLELALSTHPEVGAVLIEPIQSMAGVITADAAYFRGIRQLCDQYGAVLIFDEVQTGVGRTGAFSVCEHFGMTPDLITLAKSLGSGLPVGAVIVSDEIAQGVEPGDQGTTFGGGMIAMAAVKATLDTLASENLMAAAPAIFDEVAEGLAELDVDISGMGSLIGIHLPVSSRPIITELRKEGVLVGGADDARVIRLMPPLTTNSEEIQFFLSTFRAVLTSELQPA